MGVSDDKGPIHFHMYFLRFELMLFTLLITLLHVRLLRVFNRLNNQYSMTV